MHRLVRLVIVALLATPVALFAWTGPTQSPPNGNVAAPINTGSSAQTKSGDFAITGRMGVGTLTPSYPLHVIGNIYSSGSVYSNDWIRVIGGGGIYFQTYGGGWRMTDTTWIRSYNGKPVYMEAGFDTNAASGVACGGGLGGAYTFRVCGSAQVTNHIVTPTLCLNGACRSSWGFTTLGGHYLVNVNPNWGGTQYCPGNGLMVGMVYTTYWTGEYNYTDLSHMVCRDIY